MLTATLVVGRWLVLDLQAGMIWAKTTEWSVADPGEWYLRTHEKGPGVSSVVKVVGPSCWTSPPSKPNTWTNTGYASPLRPSVATWLR